MKDYFIDAICNSGSLVNDCDFCGRTHFATYNAGDYDEGELEALIEKQKKNPDKYIDHDASSVSWGYLDGKQIVYNCPCLEKSLEKYENFIWNHRHIIARYLKNRAAGELREKETQNNRLKDL